jgi:hypothetical protein
MPERGFFTVARAETVQPYAVLPRTGLIDLLARFAAAGAGELAGLDDAALIAKFTALVTAAPDGLHDYLLTLTEDHQETLEVGDWHISNETPVLTSVPTGTPLPDPWDDDDRFPMCDWRYEVNNGDELCGYREWVRKQREWHAEDEAAEPPPSRGPAAASPPTGSGANR